MGDRTPTENHSAKEQGQLAGYNDDPTLASYLSSLLLILAVPTLIALAFGGHWLGFYTYSGIVPAFGALVVATLIATFGVMHVASAGR